MKYELNIALLGQYFGWGGGVDFLRHVANGLLAKQVEYKLSLFLLLPVQNKIESPSDFVSVVKRSLKKSIADRRPYFVRSVPAYHPNMLDSFSHIHGNIEIIQYANTQEGLLRTLKKIGADVALPINGSLGKDYPIPWVGYIYDFQHKYYPQYFSGSECLTRDISFATTLRDAEAVIVNAQSVKDDINIFFPYHGCSIFTLPFAPTPIENWFDDPSVDTIECYNLPSDFFLISNQFWVHKSHVTAFEALSKLENMNTGRDIHIICTGITDDYRFPDYLSELKRRISALGLDAKIHIIGHIPKEDQIQIMKRSIAVLQPTLFEGGPGGGAVYDAVSLGVPVILSDIPVNREVSADNVFFFESGSSDSMATVMAELLCKNKLRTPKDILLTRGDSYKLLLGSNLMEAVCHVLGSNRA